MELNYVVEEQTEEEYAEGMSIIGLFFRIDFEKKIFVLERQMGVTALLVSGKIDVVQTNGRDLKDLTFRIYESPISGGVVGCTTIEYDTDSVKHTFSGSISTTDNTPLLLRKLFEYAVTCIDAFFLVKEKREVSSNKE